MSKKIALIVLMLIIAGGLFALVSWKNHSSLPKPVEVVKTYPPVDLTALKNSFPSPSSTPQQISDFMKTASASAVEANTLDVSDCRLQPAVLKVVAQKPFTITNNSGTSHSLVSPVIKFSTNIPANSSKQVTLDFKYSGAYPVSCDGKFSGVFSGINPNPPPPPTKQP